MGRIVVVSNRVTPFDGDASAGGLAVALKAVLESRGGLWFGWSGRVSEAPCDDLRYQRSGRTVLATLDLRPRELELYYGGFANRTLWPLLHGRTDLVRFDNEELAAYRSVNERFAQRLSFLLNDDDLVWVHDFHLTLVARELRGLGVRSPIGFFLHVPFPAPDVFAALPCERELLEALSAHDVIGFQTENDMRNFCDVITRRFDGLVDQDGTVLAFGRKFRVGTFPVGIDADRISKLAADSCATTLAGRFRRRASERMRLIGVDRLDYTKGLRHRLCAFERLLELVPHYRNSATLVQIAAPSRESVPEYIELKCELERLVGQINARMAELDWAPVQYLNKTYGQAHLAALYRTSRVGLVTPLADGMNLVAKEYVAAQAPEDPGVLVLSRFAGAAERLTGALIVNPYDIDGMAEALREALEMPLDERRARWAVMMSEIRHNNSEQWTRSFLQALGGAPRPHRIARAHTALRPVRKREPAENDRAIAGPVAANDRDARHGHLVESHW